MKYIEYTYWVVNGKKHKVYIDDYCIPVDCANPTLFVSAPASDCYYASSMHLKLINGDYFPHHESEPAFIIDDTEEDTIKYIFFNNGINIKIEDLPCDEETKVYLKLKHEIYYDTHDGMVYYK